MASGNMDTGKRSTLHERLRASRQFAGKTQAELATILGVKRPMVSQYESHNPAARSKPSAASIKAWAEACGIRDMNSLLDDTLSITDLTLIWQGRRAYRGSDSSRVVTPVEVPVPAEPLNSGRVDAWRQAVRYDVISRDESRTTAFDVPIRVVGVTLAAPYMKGRHIAAFASWDDDQARLYSTAVARLLLLESAAQRGHLSKHLVLLRGEPQPEGSMTTLTEQVCGVHIHIVNNVKDAADLIMTFA